LSDLAQSPNQKTLILPIEATSVLGSLAGIAEIAKATFGDAAPPPRPRPTPPTGPQVTAGVGAPSFFPREQG
jgi:hypothetical protein